MRITSVFFGMMLGILIMQKKHSERIRNDDKKFANDLDYNGIEFPVQEKILRRLRWKTTFELTYFVMKTDSIFQFTFHIKHLKTLWIL